MLPKISKNLIKDKSTTIDKTNLKSLISTILFTGNILLGSDITSTPLDMDDFILKPSITATKYKAHRSHSSHRSHRSHRSSSSNYTYTTQTTIVTPPPNIDNINYDFKTKDNINFTWEDSAYKYKIYLKLDF